MRSRVPLVAVSLLSLGLGACQGSEDGDSTATAPSLTAIACPPVVDDVLMGGYSCATLTTRGGDDREPVDLLVTTVEPSSGDAPEDPVIVVGADLATSLNYAGLAPAADRMQRTLVLLNARGVAGSSPELTCPEVDELGPVVPEEGKDSWVDAVDRCATRLGDAGVDVTLFGAERMADDVLDLVEALGVETWNLGAYGTSGRVALEVMGRDPAGLRAAFLDSPELPTDDTLGAAGARTTEALRRVLDACASDATCRALPHTLADVDRIAAALDEEPLVATLDPDGRAVDVAVDGRLLVRLLRHMLSNGGAHSQFFTAGAVPAVLAAAEGRDGTAVGLVLEPLLSSAPYCEGFVPLCAPHQRITLGAYLATACGHAGGPASRDGIPESVARTFDDDPYLAACERWPYPTATDSDDPIESDVPVLLLIGSWDPYVTTAPEPWLDALGGLSRLTLVQVPAWGHNVLSSGDCAQTMRNTFVADPDRPVDQSCVAALPTSTYFLEHL